MPPKKAEEKKSADNDEETKQVPGADPEELSGNYSKCVKLLGISSSLNLSCLVDEEGIPATQIIFDASSDSVVLDGQNCRAFASALLGISQGLTGIPYRNLTSIRVLRCNIGDDGASSLAEVLRMGGSDCQIVYLELIGCSIGSEGARNLGRSLSSGHNQSLVTLNLDFNTDIGKNGIASLCSGLQTNNTLKQLHLGYCVATLPSNQTEYNSQMCSSLSLLLSNPLCTLQLLKIPGLSIGCDGLTQLCQMGLRRNRNLIKLDISDNNIHSLNVDLCKSAIQELSTALQLHQTLTHINIMYNSIGDEAAALLLPVMSDSTDSSSRPASASSESSATTTTIKKKMMMEMLIDASLSDTVFNGLFRRDTSNDKKKKGKGKKKKK